MRKDCCENCKWWDESSSESIFGREVRNCVRRCPVRINADLDVLNTIHDQTRQIRIAIWPKTVGEQYCGDFEQKEEDKT